MGITVRDYQLLLKSASQMSQQTARTLTRSVYYNQFSESNVFLIVMDTFFCMAGERSIQPSNVQFGQRTIQDSKLCDQSQKRNRSINFNGLLVTTLELSLSFYGKHFQNPFTSFVSKVCNYTTCKKRLFLYLQGTTQSMEILKHGDRFTRCRREFFFCFFFFSVTFKKRREKKDPKPPLNKETAM